MSCICQVETLGEGPSRQRARCCQGLKGSGVSVEDGPFGVTEAHGVEGRGAAMSPDASISNDNRSWSFPEALLREARDAA